LINGHITSAPKILNQTANIDRAITKSDFNQNMLLNKYTIKSKNKNQITARNKLKNTCEKATCFFICFHHIAQITAVKVVHK
jgi:hypothetical protein